MARTPNRPPAKPTRQGTRDDELRGMLSETEDPASDETDFLEMGQEIEVARAPRVRDPKIFGLGAAERAFVSVVILLIVVIFGVALLIATGRIRL